MRRLRFGRRGEENQPPDDEDQDDNQHDEAGHGRAFAEQESRCIAPVVTELSNRLDRPVVLVGLMGVGKSTVGRRLAKRLGLPFVDSDAEIEDAAGYSPAEIFERYGERDFRDGERRLVARLIEGDVGVIATGGGAFVDPRTRKLLNERAITSSTVARSPSGSTRRSTSSRSEQPGATPARSCATATPNRRSSGSRASAGSRTSRRISM